MNEKTRERARRVRHRLRSGAFLLPSLFTIGNIILGFYAIVRGLRGDFQNAALMIFLGAALDGLDGRIARATHTESEFGKEFDSLADVLTFGAAPALLSYLWGLQELGRVGWIFPLYFLVCNATRLARFNVQTRIVDSRYFVGLPVPAAAGSIAAFLFVAPSSDWRPWAEAAMLFGLFCVGSLMVSTFRYPSFKKIDLHEPRSYRMVAVLLGGMLLILAVRPTYFFLAGALIYTLVGPLGWLWSRLRRRDTAEAPAPEAGEPESKTSADSEPGLS